MSLIVRCLIGIAFVELPWCVTVFAVDPAGRPSVILISIDTLRADHLSCYGYRGLRTPHIDTIAETGTLLSQVDAQVPLTLPSHASLLTSTYPFRYAVEDNGQQLRTDADTLASALRSRGYRTAAFVGGFVLDRRFGLDQGFDLYDSPFNLRHAAGKDPGDIKRFGEEVTRAAEHWLAQNPSRPFFIFLHLYDMHTPYEFPPGLRARPHRSGYDAELSYVDATVGEFWDFLSQRDILKQALIVLTSDHGESLGEHGESTHGYFIYESTLHVPLIFHWPETSKSFSTRIDNPVSLLDVAPTILQFVGAPRPPNFQGRSLLGLIIQKTNEPAEEIYGETLYGHYHLGTSSLRTLRSGQYKYIAAPKPEFYDLTEDPRETRNLVASRPSLFASYRERLLALRARFDSAQSTDGKPALSPETVERLRSLGYMTLSANRTRSPESGTDPKDRIEEYEAYGRAVALASAGRLDRADAILQELLAKDPELLDVRLNLGLNQQKLGRHDEAAMNFREVLSADPLNILAHFDLGVSYFELHRLDDAIKELEAALAIAPYYTRAEELLGSIWLEKKYFDRARSRLQHLLLVDPNNYAAHYNLGVLATLNGRWESAESHLRAAVQTDPAAAEAHNALGSVYLERKDVDRARAEFEESIRLEPKFAPAHYNLGLALLKETKKDEAASEFRRALAADPQFKPAREALDRLKEHKN